MTPGPDPERPGNVIDPIDARLERALENTVYEWTKSEEIARMEFEIWPADLNLY